MQAQLQFRMALGGAGRLDLVRTDWVTRNLSAEVATFIDRCAPCACPPRFTASCAHACILIRLRVLCPRCKNALLGVR